MTPEQIAQLKAELLAANAEAFNTNLIPVDKTNFAKLWLSDKLLAITAIGLGIQPYLGKATKSTVTEGTFMYALHKSTITAIAKAVGLYK